MTHSTPSSSADTRLHLALVDRSDLEAAFGRHPERLTHYLFRGMTITRAELEAEIRYARIGNQQAA